jgi:hypothetical protein
VSEKWVTRADSENSPMAKTRVRNTAISMGLFWWQIRCVENKRSVRRVNQRSTPEIGDQPLQTI